MAQEVLIRLTCDKCDTKTDAETTESFAVNGTSLELDLCPKHKQAFDKAMEGWSGVARRTTRSAPQIRSGRQARKMLSSQPPYNEDQCRAWATKQGLNVKATGRLSPTTIKAWRDAGSPAA